MTESQFRLVRRGYEPAEVDQRVHQLRSTVEQLQTDLARAREDNARQSVEITKQRQQAGDLTGRIEMLEQALAEARAEQDHGVPLSYADLGERIGQMLTLAQQEADHLRENASTEYERLTAEAQQLAADTALNSEREAAETILRAQAVAARTIKDAKQQADQLREEAEAEATARREEAEALYEGQRARAAQAAADFERALAERRTAAMNELNETLAKKTHEIDLATQELVEARGEAERVTTESRAQADQIVRDAQAEASTLLSEAKRRAEGIRQNSERELAAATARRDSITAQLANVRQMLATLGSPQSAFTDPFNPRSAQAWTSETDGESAVQSAGAKAEEAIDAPVAEQLDAEMEALDQTQSTTP